MLQSVINLVCAFHLSGLSAPSIARRKKRSQGEVWENVSIGPEINLKQRTLKTDAHAEVVRYETTDQSK